MSEHEDLVRRLRQATLRHSKAWTMRGRMRAAQLLIGIARDAIRANAGRRGDPLLPGQEVAAGFAGESRMHAMSSSPPEKNDAGASAQGHSREALERAVIGALRSAINDHGPISADRITSAAKRILGNLANAGVRIKPPAPPAAPADPPEKAS